jgi:hypothetical protein
MDKARFVEVAPLYYALAICSAMKADEQVLTRYELFESFAYIPDDALNHEEENYLHNQTLLKAAEKWLAENNMVHLVEDDFGPPFYRKTLLFKDKWFELLMLPDSIFDKYQSFPDGSGWLGDALEKVNGAYSRLGITDADFSDEHKDDEWQPISLDREDKSLKLAIESLDETIDLVRGDNGYSATVPEERNYVLITLSAAQKRLKEDAAISFVWAKKFLLEPLIMLTKRFCRAATGIAASVAKEAFRDWLRKRGISFFDDL